MRNEYPYKGTADHLESYGRNGDSMLVHMNPVEVAGIAALTPKGLTRNPHTGLLEAFNWMESIIPMAAGIALTAVSGGTLAAPVAMGLGSGMASAAMTGDIQRGLLTGAMGAAGGAAMGAAGTASADAAAGLGAEALTGELAGQAATDLAGQAVADATTSTLAGGMAELGGEQAMMQLTEEQLAQAAMDQGIAGMGSMTAVPDVGVAGTGIGADIGGAMPTSSIPASSIPEESMMQGIRNSFSGANEGAYAEMAPGDRAMAPFQKDGNFLGEISKPSRVMPIAIAGNQLAEMDAADASSKSAKEQEEENEKQRRAAYEGLQAAYRSSQPGAQPGLNSWRDYMSPNIPKPWTPGGYAQGGQVKQMGQGGSLGGWRGFLKMKDGPTGDILNDQTLETAVAGTENYLSNSNFLPQGYNSTMQGRGSAGRGMGESATSRPGPNPYAGAGAGQAGIAGRGGSNGIDPVTVQRGLRGAHSVSPPDWFRPGFDPEFDYFQDDPNNVQTPTPTSRQAWQNMYPPFERMAQPDQPYFQSLTGGEDGTEGQVSKEVLDIASKIPVENNKITPIVDNGMAAGGEVPLNTTMGQYDVPAGGIANIPNQYTNPAQPVQEIPQMMQAEQALNPTIPQAMPEPGGQPSDQDIQMLAMAVLGQAGEDADKIIEGFIAQFGTDMFREARDFILKQMSPDAQTEGMIEGQGGGMDDMVPGMIAGQEEVAVSPGEYIVPADVVSGMGDGSSDAGAQELDAMLDRVRMARGGTTTQPQPFDAKKVMPV